MRAAALVVIVLAQLVGPRPAVATTSEAVLPVTSLRCQDQIGASPAPSPALVTAVGRVALPTRDALGAVYLPDAPDPNTRYWAKYGLQIKVNTSFELVVPPDWRGRLAIGWGNPSQPTTRLRVSACPWMPTPSQSSPPGEWLGFAGGFRVRNPACVPLLVKAGNTTRRVHIGVGAPCPGQSPPPHTPTSAT